MGRITDPSAKDAQHRPRKRCGGSGPLQVGTRRDSRSERRSLWLHIDYLDEWSRPFARVRHSEHDSRTSLSPWRSRGVCARRRARVWRIVGASHARTDARRGLGRPALPLRRPRDRRCFAGRAMGQPSCVAARVFSPPLSISWRRRRNLHSRAARRKEPSRSRSRRNVARSSGLVFGGSGSSDRPRSVASKLVDREKGTVKTAQAARDHGPSTVCQGRPAPIGLVAGVITAVSPCVLPVLRIVFAGSAAGEGRRRSLAITVGLLISSRRGCRCARTVYTGRRIAPRGAVLELRFSPDRA